MDDPFTAYAARMCAVHLGSEPPAALLALLDKLIGTSKNGGRRACFYLQIKAEVCCFVDQPRLAIDAISRAVDLGMADLVWMDRNEELAPARALPAYGTLRARVATRAARVLDALFGDLGSGVSVPCQHESARGLSVGS